MAEVIEDRDSLDDPINRFRAKCRNPRHHHGDAASQSSEPDALILVLLINVS